MADKTYELQHQDFHLKYLKGKKSEKKHVIESENLNKRTKAKKNI